MKPITEQDATTELMRALNPDDGKEKKQLSIKIINTTEIDKGLKCREKVKGIIDAYKKEHSTYDFETQFKLLMDIFEAFENGRDDNYCTYYLSAKATFAYVALKEHDIHFLNLSTDNLINKYLDEKPVIFQMAKLHTYRMVTYDNPFEF